MTIATNFASLLRELVADTYCHVHETMEPRSEKPYLICFECGHVYETAADLERDYVEQAMFPSMTPAKVAELICFCPHCLHDF